MTQAYYRSIRLISIPAYLVNRDTQVECTNIISSKCARAQPSSNDEYSIFDKGGRVAVSVFGWWANGVDDIPLHGEDAESFESIVVLLSVESPEYVHMVFVYGGAVVFDSAAGHGWVWWVNGPPVVHIIILLFVIAFFSCLVIMIR
jgi:hypothetical protein